MFSAPRPEIKKTTFIFYIHIFLTGGFDFCNFISRDLNVLYVGESLMCIDNEFQRFAPE